VANSRSGTVTRVDPEAVVVAGSHDGTLTRIEP